MKHFGASWSKLLIWSTILTSTLFLGIALLIFTNILPQEKYPVWFGYLGIIIIGFASLFMIRGYSLTPDFILVHRLFWDTLLPRNDIIWARYETKVWKWSIRTFGNGGFFSFTGFYWNRKIRLYRAYITDWNHCIVLRYRTRTIVISPNDPEAFLKELSVPNIGY